MLRNLRWVSYKLESELLYLSHHLEDLLVGVVERQSSEPWVGEFDLVWGLRLEGGRLLVNMYQIIFIILKFSLSKFGEG